jgi:hypothetical protein
MYVLFSTSCFMLAAVTPESVAFVGIADQGYGPLGSPMGKDTGTVRGLVFCKQGLTSPR